MLGCFVCFRAARSFQFAQLALGLWTNRCCVLCTVSVPLGRFLSLPKSVSDTWVSIALCVFYYTSRDAVTEKLALDPSRITAIVARMVSKGGRDVGEDAPCRPKLSQAQAKSPSHLHR